MGGYQLNFQFQFNMTLFTTSFFVMSFCSFACGLDIENINSLFENQKECNTKDNKNDIALLRLSESVPLFNENPMISAVLPVCLPWSDEELSTEDAEKGIVTGWGRITNNLWINRDKLIKNRAGSRVQ